MCKEMKQQRVALEKKWYEELEKTLSTIRLKGSSAMPTVMVDMEKVFIANREYFEQHGFFFEPVVKVKNNQICYYAYMKLGGGDGELGKDCWKKIREAKEFYLHNQRNKIEEKLKDAQGACILVDMEELLLDNKLHFESRGFVFETYTQIENGRVWHLARMKKKRR